MFGLFNKKDSVPIDNGNLAERIFKYRTYQPYVKECEDKEVRKICWDCKDVQDALLKVIEVCREPNTPQKRFLYAITYAWSRVEYNDLAIKHLELYLNNELYDKEYGNTKEKNNYHLYTMWKYLGEAYEKKYSFDKALECYEQCLNYYGEFQVPYLDIANIYKKMNKLDKSIETLEKAKNTKYYKDEFKDVIDSYYNDYLEKIKKGYKYKQRKKVC